MNQELMALTMLVKTALPLAGSSEPLLVPVPNQIVRQEDTLQEAEVLVEKTLSLDNRLPNKAGARVFADNILLNLHYIKEDVDSFKNDKEKNGPANIDWEKIREPFEVSFILKSGEFFAFHKNILEEYKEKPGIVIKSHFSFEDGYKALGGLYGNGVCHFASLINWAASEAGLEVMAPVNHDFYPVPEVPREYGTSILYWPDNGRNTQKQNLYLSNTFDSSLVFIFKANEREVSLKIQKSS